MTLQSSWGNIHANMRNAILSYIVTEEDTYLQIGLLSMQNYETHIKKEPYSNLFMTHIKSMLLLKKLKLIGNCAMSSISKLNNECQAFLDIRT